MTDQTTKTRIWFDTEFIEDGKTIDLISIGLVREDGHYMLLENTECDRSKASDWVRNNVFPHLGEGMKMTRQEIAAAVKSFVGKAPEFWAYYADYDWVALCQLYGTMMDLPKGWPMFCLDIKQEAYRLGDPELPKQETGEHNALADARWNKRSAIGCGCQKSDGTNMKEVKLEMPDPQTTDPKRGDLPPSCAVCVFHAPRDVVSLFCRRHGPSPGREGHEIVSWPTVMPNQRCGAGSLGAPYPNGVPKQIVSCELCKHWFSPEGGLPYDGPADPSWWENQDAAAHDQGWWRGAGLCLLRAPVPSVGYDADPTHWKVTHFTDGCGDGRDYRDERE